MLFYHIRHLGLIFLNGNRLQVVNDLRLYYSAYCNIPGAIDSQNEFDLVAPVDIIDVSLEGDDFVFLVRTVDYVGWDRH
jgi:hypothetical protein